MLYGKKVNNSNIKSVGKRKKTKKACAFDNKENMPFLNYMNIGLLSTYLNEKGFIRKKAKTILCSKHQRYLRKMIIRARHLHLLPYISY